MLVVSRASSRAAWLSRFRPYAAAGSSSPTAGRAWVSGVCPHTLQFETRRHMHPSSAPHHQTAIQDIRNIGIIAHVDAGKTTTTERMLYYSGVTHRVGDVDAGNTVTDFLDLERERGITIQSAAITLRWPLPETLAPGTTQKTINLIDTPGHQDFRFEVDRCLPVLDGAVCIIDAVKGVEAHTERVWASAHEHGIPRIIYVNKLDRDGASFRKSVLEVASRLNGWPLICQIPWWEKDQFVGVIDVIDQVGFRWKSEKQRSRLEGDALQAALASSNPSLAEEMSVARERLIEGLAELDETIMDLFIEDPARITSQVIKEGLRRSIRSGDGRAIPVLAGASFRHIGVEQLMDAVVDYLPSPDERPELKVRVGDEKQTLAELVSSHADKKGRQGRLASVASVFKVFKHPQEGMLSYVRVYHGELHRNASAWNSHALTSESSMGLLQISANKTEVVQHLSPGQIGAMKGLKKARTGDTLLTTIGNRNVPDSLKHVHIRPPEIPPAVAFLAIDPYGNVAAQELETLLDQMSRQDPSLRWSRDERSDQFILQGMGKLHLEIAVHNLKQNLKNHVDFGPIEVDYKECLTAATTPHALVFDKPVAGKQGKVSCTVTLEPLEDHHRESQLEPTVERDHNMIHINIDLPEDGRDLTFDPDEARQQLLNGVAAAVARGPRRYSPVQDCHITINVDTDASATENPTGGHFSAAAYRAVRDALRSAHEKGLVGLLEPVMLLHISCPESAAGQVQHDINSGAGGQVLEIHERVVDSTGGATVASSSSSPGGGPDGEGEGEVRPRVDVSAVYAPPDPYDSITSLREKKSTRMVEIVAKVPFKEVLDFDQNLRSKTGGRHSMTMAFDSFDRVVGPRERAL